MDRNVKVREISAYLESVAPLEMKEDFDNVGLLVGLTERNVTKVLVALDITDEVIEEACEMGAQMIVSHHPLFFSCKDIKDTDLTGKKIIRLIENSISAVCMHTNLDAAWWGVNTVLAGHLGLSNIRLLEKPDANPDSGEYGIPKFGTLDMPMEFADFLKLTKHSLSSNGLRYHDAGRMVEKVALCGGSGGNFLGEAHRQGCDTFVTADIKYNVFLDARELGINLIDGDHFCTENVVCPTLKEKLLEGFPGLEVSISSIHSQAAKFF